MAMDYLSEELRQALSSLDRTERALQTAEANYTPSIKGERYLTGEELCEYLHISPRTLQTLRDTRQITYTTVSDGYSSIRRGEYEKYWNRIAGWLSLTKQMADGNYFRRPFSYLLSDPELLPDLRLQGCHIPPDLVVGNLGVNLCRGDMLMP